MNKAKDQLEYQDPPIVGFHLQGMRLPGLYTPSLLSPNWSWSLHSSFGQLPRNFDRVAPKSTPDPVLDMSTPRGPARVFNPGDYDL
jgi:hypothetical protein